MKTALDEPAVGNKCFPLPAAASALSRPFQLGLCFCGLLGALQSVRAQQNTPPIISAIPGQVTAEDVPLIGIPFTVWDAETAPEQLTFSTALDLGGSLSRDSILISGNGTNRALSIFPPPDSFGTGVAFVTVRDAGGLATAIKFNVEVRPVNDPPRLSPIPDQVALKGQGVFRVPFSAFDVETGERLSLQAWSSRQGVVSNSALQFVQGFGLSNRVLNLTLGLQGTTGSTAITIQANDKQDTNRVSFILNVVEPEFGQIGRADGGLPAVQGFQPAWGDFNGDGLLDLVVSPTQIMTNRGSGLLGPGIPLPGGVGVTGVAPADFDGDGKLDLLVLGGFSRLLRNNGGNPPGFSEVPLPRRKVVAPKEFWADLDGDGDLDILSGSVFDQTDWLRNLGRDGFVLASLGFPLNVPGSVLAVGDFDNDGDPDILVGTSTASPTLRLYENDGTGRFQQAQVSLPQSLTRAAGWADVNGDGVLDLWLVQALASISPSNTLVVLRQTQGQFTETFRLNYPTLNSLGAPTNFAWADFDNDGNLDFAGPIGIRAQPGIAPTNYTTIYHNDGTGRFTTTGLAASVQVGQPLPTPADFDDDGSVDLLYRVQSLIPLRNQARLLNSLPGSPVRRRAFVVGSLVTLFWTDADDANQSAALTYNVRIGTAPGQNDVVPSMSTTNGVRMIPAPGNAGFNNWMTIKLPSDQLNIETLHWSVQAVDASFQGGPFAAEQTFLIDLPGNTPPSIVGIGDISFPEDTTTNIVFYVRDDRTPPNGLRVQAASSNPALVPQSGLRLSGLTNTDQGLRVTLGLTPLTNQFGETIITITATDRSGLSASRFFVATVTPVNDPPVMTSAETLLGLVGAPAPPFPIEVFDLETPADQLVVAAHSLAPEIVPDSNLVLAHMSGGDWALVVTRAVAEPAQARIELTVRDSQGAQAQRTVDVFFQRAILTPYATLSVIGSWPNQLIWADFNGDRRLELLVRDAQQDGLTIHGLESGSLPLLAAVTSSTNYSYPFDIADFDNDGDIDLLVSGVAEGGAPIRLLIYRNLGGFQFERVPSAVFDLGVARFADFDLDGRPDVLVAESTKHLVVYRNNGVGFETGRRFSLESSLLDTPWIESLTAVNIDGAGRDELFLVAYDVGSRRQAVFGWAGERFAAITNTWATNPLSGIADFDQDQLPDLVTNPWVPSQSSFWRNLGQEFDRVDTISANTESKGAMVADFDGDGTPDLAAYGYRSNLLQVGSRDFTFVPIQLPFAQANVAVAVPADFDGDGVMDLAASLASSSLLAIEVYRGESGTSNRPPASPPNLRAQPIGTDAVGLSWDRATDPNQSGGLTYNVRVGTAPGLGDVVSPMSLADGFRLAPRIGNAAWSTNRLLTSLKPGRTYYWSVQAVDNSFAGGPFAPEVSFTVPAAALTLSPVGAGQVEIGLRAAPVTVWRIAVSDDLITWSAYPAANDAMQTGTNGACWMRMAPSGGRQFFRAWRADP